VVDKTTRTLAELCVGYVGGNITNNQSNGNCGLPPPPVNRMGLQRVFKD